MEHVWCSLCTKRLLRSHGVRVLPSLSLRIKLTHDQKHGRLGLLLLCHFTCELIWAKSNQDAADSEKEKRCISPLTAWKNLDGGPYRNRAVTRGYFYQSDPPAGLGKYLIPRRLPFSSTCEAPLHQPWSPRIPHPTPALRGADKPVTCLWVSSVYGAPVCTELSSCFLWICLMYVCLLDPPKNPEGKRIIFLLFCPNKTD